MLPGLGDWSAVEPKSLVTTATGFMHATAVMLSEFAAYLDKPTDSAKYTGIGKH